MMLSKSLMLALTVTGGAAVAAFLAIKNHKQQQEADQHEKALQVWDDETGSPASPAVASPPP